MANNPTQASHLKVGTVFTNEFGTWVLIRKGPGGVIISPNSGKAKSIKTVEYDDDGNPMTKEHNFVSKADTLWVASATPVDQVISTPVEPEVCQLDET